MGKDAFTYSISYDDPNVTDIKKLRAHACMSNTDENPYLYTYKIVELTIL